MSERWITRDEAIGAVRAQTVASIGRAQKILDDALKSGEIRRDAEPIYTLNDDAYVGAKSAAQKHGIDASGKPVIHTLVPPREPLISADDLTDWLMRSYPTAGTTTVPSTTALTKIDAARQGVAACYPDGVSASVANKVLCRVVGEWLKQNHRSLGEISDDTIERAAGRK
jgi:F420-0:gamma-glutamyl ligase